MYNTQHNNGEKAEESRKEKTQNEQMKGWKYTERWDETGLQTGWLIPSLLIITNITVSRPDGGIHRETADMFTTVWLLWINKWRWKHQRWDKINLILFMWLLRIFLSLLRTQQGKKDVTDTLLFMTLQFWFRMNRFAFIAYCWTCIRLKCT